MSLLKRVNKAISESVPNKPSKAGYASFQTETISDQDASNIIIHLSIKGYTFSGEEDTEEISAQKAAKSVKERANTPGWGINIHKEGAEGPYGTVVGALTDDGEEGIWLHGEKIVFDDLKSYELESETGKDLPAFQQLLAKVDRKPASDRIELLHLLVGKFYGEMSALPSGKQKIMKLIKEFKLENKIN